MTLFSFVFVQDCWFVCLYVNCPLPFNWDFVISLLLSVPAASVMKCPLPSGKQLIINSNVKQLGFTFQCDDF